MNVKAFITHKLSEDYSSCQDYFAINGDNRAICLSDGMSQSIFPDYWAKIVSQHVADNFEFSEESRINKLCPQWKAKVLEYIEKEKSEGKNPWRLESNLEEGLSAGCTICGVRFLSSSEWEGLVLGDSCIVAVDWASNSLEILSSEDKEFDSYPDYVDSNPLDKGKGTIRVVNGRVDKDTTLLLVSDPFSEYLSKHQDRSVLLAKELADIQTHDDFVALVARWRENGMHNDDSTLVVVDFDEQEALNVEVADSLEDLIRKESEEPVAAEEPETGETQPDGGTVAEDTAGDVMPVSGSAMPVSGNVIDIPYLKSHSEEVIERFLDSQKTRSAAELFGWLVSWRQQVKTTLKRYNDFITSIEPTEAHDTDTGS